MNTGVELYTKTLISVAYCETIKRWHKSNIIEKKSTLAQILHNSNTANNQLQLLHVNNQCYCFCQIFSKGEDLTCSSLKDITENAREYCEKKGILEQFSTMLSILEIESDDPADTQDHNRYSVLSGDDSFENTYLYLDQENDYILFPEKCTCSGRSSFQNQSINIGCTNQMDLPSNNECVLSGEKPLGSEEIGNMNENEDDARKITSTPKTYLLKTVNSTNSFYENIDFCSTRNKNISHNCTINVSNDSDSLIEEYNVLRKKILISKLPTKRPTIVSPEVEGFKQSVCKYKKIDCDIKFSKEEELFLLRSRENRKMYLNFMQDLLRTKFGIFNNVCPINFSSHKFHKKKLVLYAKCMYYLSGCGAYKFVIDFDSIITVYASSLEITHPKTAKKHQLRGVRRLLAKQHIKYLRPTNWRDKLLIKQSKHLKALGNDQGVVSKDAARRIKFEQVRSIDRDADSHIDICKMYLDKNWRTYIQKVALPQEIYLISKRPIEILQAKNFALLKLSHNTLFFDATGSIMRKIVEKDIKAFQKDEEIASFYKLQVWKAINISKIDDFFIWLRIEMPLHWCTRFDYWLDF
ncbi:uncharacterized protein LOC131997965 [Stomoxys calcitrans]|uniref:uncharacterized protein LOC131997965 n=1 Tax=Stomoxys calcitrans TaxID=35570 RepID=UPI0027E28B29|nr:uncharacterized protein LOC131997965 [Stomoxys calcitrans]